MPRIARFAVGGLILIALAVIGAVTWHRRYSDAPSALVLHGNVDLRQVDLAFNDSERVAAVLVQEGARVRRGQLLAQLETSRLQPQVAQAQALLEMQQQVVDRLHHGNRPQEIEQAAANAAAAQAQVDDARAQYERVQAVAASSAGRAVSHQDLDAAKAAFDTASARLAASQQALQLERLGPRREDVAQAEAQLRADRAALALLQQHLADTDLRAPLDAVVRSRDVEPGDMASPQKTAFTLAITSPKWVRAYVDEPDLGRVREGLRAHISVDAFPGRDFAGWIGFISPQAEFTPKSVETSELRSSLVYEVRVFVEDPDDRLRLGMPATVRLEPMR